jgi:ribosome-associated translation inhibitor RaiA
MSTTAETPLEVRYQDVPKEDWIEEFIRERLERLKRYAREIMHCRVAIEQPHKRHEGENPFHVRVELSLPQKKHLAATAESEEVPQAWDKELRRVIKEAFQAMEKQLS